MVSERKLDSSFPNPQFVIEGYAPWFRCDGIFHGDKILNFIRENIHATMINTKPSNNFEVFFVDLNLLEKFFFGAVPITLIKVTSQIISFLFEKHWIFKCQSIVISLLQGILIQSYQNLLWILFVSRIIFIIKSRLFWKSRQSPCIDLNHLFPMHLFSTPGFLSFQGLEKGCIGKNGLILTNCSKSSMNTQTAGTGLLDFHKLLLTVLIIRYEKLGSKTKTYYRL